MEYKYLLSGIILIVVSLIVFVKEYKKYIFQNENEDWLVKIIKGIKSILIGGLMTFSVILFLIGTLLIFFSLS